MQEKKLPLKRFISLEFFKAALLPLLFIELALVVLYFSINSYNQGIAVAALEQESLSHLKVIAGDQTNLIGKQLRAMFCRRKPSAFSMNRTRFPNPRNPKYSALRRTGFTTS